MTCDFSFSRGDLEDCCAFATASSKFGLKINMKKLEVMFQPNYTTARAEDINVDDTTINPVQEFAYLSSIIARDGHTEAELQKRMSKVIMLSNAYEKDSGITTMCS